MTCLLSPLQLYMMCATIEDEGTQGSNACAAAVFTDMAVLC